MSEGFFGPPTSSVDWCEANYAQSFYVCEFWNSVSSLAMVLAGVVGIALHWRVLERRFLAAFALLSLVGFGSVAFHASLRFSLQLLDELPMLYLVILMVWILVELEPVPRFGRPFAAALWAHAALVTGLSALTRGPLQFWVFQLSFGSLEFFSLYKVWRTQRASPDEKIRRLFRLGIAAYAFAIAIWFFDLRFCALVTGPWNPQLHAFWHVLVSFGFYALVLVIAAERQRRIGKPVRLEGLRLVAR